MMELTKVIKGNIVLPSEVVPNAFMTIKDGVIHSISSQMSKEDISTADFIDASDKYVFPGAIDAHVHCYTSLEEGFFNATRSAAAGGVTTIIEMPYDADKLICNQDVFEEKKELIVREAVTDVALLATIAPQDGLDQIPLLANSGACGFKVSLFNTDPIRFPKIEEGILLKAFKEIQKTKVPVGVHAETNSIVQEFIKKFQERGTDNPIAHCKSRPHVAESTAVLTALELAYYTGAKLHLYHSTFSRIFKFAEQYREDGVNVTAETCTHYLMFSENDMETLGAKGKINPPLRKASDKEDLWTLLSENKIDMVTSDHAPWLSDQKQFNNIFENSSGAPGVEVLFPIMFSEGVSKGRLSVLQLAKLLSENPADRFGLGHRKGKLKVGYDADFLILDPAKSHVLIENDMHTTSDWSPYHSLQLQGKIIKVFVRGHEVYNGQTSTQENIGEFVRAIHK